MIDVYYLVAMNKLRESTDLGKPVLAYPIHYSDARAVVVNASSARRVLLFSCRARAI